MARYGVNMQIIIGNLGADAEMVYVGKKETPKATFRIAATVRLRTNGEAAAREQTEWFNCILWGKRAEALSPYLSKGSRVYVEGRTETHSWEDDSGKTRYRTEVRVNELVFLGGRNGGGEGTKSKATAEGAGAPV
jgi:single-strand DNA-binding protein